MSRISKDQIKTEMRRLGLAEGDLVFVSSDLMRVGYFNKDRDTTMRDWVEILLSAVGPTGTIVVPSYSPSYIRFVQRSDFVFSKDSASDAGSLATAFLSFADHAVRGAHPTSSCVAVGPLAQFVAGDHTVGDPAYKPYGRIIEQGGQNLMLGTIDTKNCPMSFHYAQQVLGHTRTTRFVACWKRVTEMSMEVSKNLLCVKLVVALAECINAGGISLRKTVFRSIGLDVVKAGSSIQKLPLMCSSVFLKKTRVWCGARTGIVLVVMGATATTALVLSRFMCESRCHCCKKN